MSSILNCSKKPNVPKKSQLGKHVMTSVAASLSTESLTKPAKTQSNLFDVPAILSQDNCSHSRQGYTFTFMYKETKESAVLLPTFLTALEKDGVKINWEEAKSLLKLGCEAKIDVTQSKPASFIGNWLAFGLYLGDVSSESGNQDENFFNQRRRLSKEFDWMRDFDKGVGNKDVLFNTIETQLADIEDSVFVYSSELNSAEKALVEVRGKLDDCMIDIDGDSSGQLNETFTVEESSTDSPFLHTSPCQHKYEVGVVAISVTQQCLHLVGPLNDTWVRTEVRPSDTPVFVKGGRMTDSAQVMSGDIGSLVSKLCVKCQLDTTVECLATPLLVWFGEEQKPSVRSVPGVVVWREEDKFLVQLDGSGLVLFTGSDQGMILENGCKVLVWAWSKPGNCAEGGAWILQASHQEEQDLGVACTRQEVGHTLAFEDLDLSTSGIFSPIRATEEERTFTGNDIIGFVAKSDSDKCSDVSFGSVSECDEIDLNKSFSTNLSMIINSTSNTACSLTTQEDEFQTLYSRSSFSFPDGVDIDLQFEQVLTANGLVDNYDNLARKYEEYFQASQRPSIIAKPTGTPMNASGYDNDPLAYRSPPSPSISFEICPPEILLNPSLLRRMPCSSLSPIPEEVSENYSEIPVFSTPVCRSAEDSGYIDSFCSGSSSINPSRSLVYSAEKTPASASNTNSQYKQFRLKEMLEQFLEFTQFPASRRNDLIDQFVVSNAKEVA